MKGVHEGDPFGAGAEWDQMLKESSVVTVCQCFDGKFDLRDSKGDIIKYDIELPELLEFIRDCPHLTFEAGKYLPAVRE